MNKQRAKRAAKWPWQVTEESQAVHVGDIVRDPMFQVRLKGIPKLAKKYADEMQCGHKFPAVSIADVEGTLYLVDGWHRTDAAAEILGSTTIEAVVRKLSRKEALGLASEANATHGHGLSQADKRKKLAMHIRAGKHKKGREIVQTYGDLSEYLGIKKTTLYRWMEKDHPPTFEKMKKDTPQKRDAEPPEAFDYDPENLRRALEALRMALHHCDLLRDPEKRQEAIDGAERVIVQMKLKEHHGFEW